MKSITLLMTDSKNVHINDNDDSELKEYVDKLSSVLKSGNVTILETSSGTLILRPNKISSILVEEITKEDESLDKQQAKPTEDPNHVDLITDG